MEKEIANYIIENWEVIAGGIATLFIASITVTWTIAKLWYTRQLAISKAECEYLEKKNSDKDCYVNGVMEVMTQRLSLAQEEPKRLQILIDEKESQLHDLKKENKSLLDTIKKNDDGSELEARISNMTIFTLRHTLRSTIKMNELCFPKHEILSPLRTHFFRWDKKTHEKDTDLGQLASFLTILTNAQNIHSIELDFGLTNCYKDLSSIRKETNASWERIFSPFTNNFKNNDLPPIDVIYSYMPVHQLKYYIELAERLEEKRKEESGETKELVLKEKENASVKETEGAE